MIEDRQGAVREAKILSAKTRADKRRRLAEASISEPLDWQETHSPTEPVMVRVSATRAPMELTRIRISEARLWERLTGLQRHAAERLEMGFRLVVDGNTVRAASYERMGHQYFSPSERDERLRSDYLRWADEMDRLHQPVGPVLDILVFGRGCREIDRAGGKRNGWAADTVKDALFLYARLWLRRN